MPDGRGAIVMASSERVCANAAHKHKGVFVLREPGSWTVLSSRDLLDASPFLKVRVETIRLPDGRCIPDYYQLDMLSFACILAETARWTHDGGLVVQAVSSWVAPNGARLSGRTSRTRRSSLRRRPTISESTRPLGSTRHCIPSEAKPSAVPPPPARRFGGFSSADAAKSSRPFLTRPALETRRRPSRG